MQPKWYAGHVEGPFHHYWYAGRVLPQGTCHMQFVIRFR